MDMLRTVVLGALILALLVAAIKGSRPPQPGILRPRHTLGIVSGFLLTLIGLAGSGACFRSGWWGLGHGWPILLISIPILLIGLALLRHTICKTRTSE